MVHVKSQYGKKSTIDATNNFSQNHLCMRCDNLYPISILNVFLEIDDLCPEIWPSVNSQNQAPVDEYEPAHPRLSKVTRHSKHLQTSPTLVASHWRLLHNLIISALRTEPTFGSPHHALVSYFSPFTSRGHARRHWPVGARSLRCPMGLGVLSLQGGDPPRP